MEARQAVAEHGAHNFLDTIVAALMAARKNSSHLTHSDLAQADKIGGTLRCC